MGTYKKDGTSTFESPYKGKTMSILGASYDLVYPQFGLVESDMWWYKVCNALGMSINTNNSISGSSVCGDPTGDTAGCGTRATSLGTLPDVIFVNLGGNDFGSNYGIGSYDGSQTFPTSGSTFREAYAIMMKKIMEAYPKAEIWCRTIPYIREHSGSVEFPEKNGNSVLLKTWNDTIAEMANLYGAGVIHLEECGMTWFNREHFAGDYDPSAHTAVHPNPYGQSAMANQIIRTIDPTCGTRFALWDAEE